MRLLSFFIPLLWFFVGAANAYNCTFDSSPYYITTDPVVINSNANAGAKVGSQITSSIINYMSSCSSTLGINKSMMQFSALATEDKTIYDNRYVYRLADYKGLGIAIGASMASCARSSTGLEQWAGTGSGTHYFTLCYSSSSLANPTYQPRVLLQFYKMSTIPITTTVVSQMLVGEIFMNINNSVENIPRKPVYLSLKVIQASCSISTPNITVNLPKMYKTEFDKTSDLGTGTAVPFSIGVACGSTAVPLKIQITGANGNYVANMGIMYADTSITNSVDGVGIQILTSSGKPFRLAEDYLLGSLSGTNDNVLTLSARYARVPRKTGTEVQQNMDPIVVGKLKASATITLLYQ